MTEYEIMLENHIKALNHKFLEHRGMLTAFRRAANSLAVAAGVTRDHVDHDEAATSVTGDHYFLELLAEVELRVKGQVSNPTLPIRYKPGPVMWMPKMSPEEFNPKRHYTLTLANGVRVRMVARSLGDVMKTLGDVQVINSVSRPLMKGE